MCLFNKPQVSMHVCLLGLPMFSILPDHKAYACPHPLAPHKLQRSEGTQRAYFRLPRCRQEHRYGKQLSSEPYITKLLLSFFDVVRIAIWMPFPETPQSVSARVCCKTPKGEPARPSGVHGLLPIGSLDGCLICIA